MFLTSCSSVTKNYLIQEKTINKIENNYFSDSSKDYVYKAKIDIYGNYIGGIIIIKRLAKNHHRIVFTTEFGVKMFDIELKEEQLIKNKVVEKLDRKLILNTLKKDFQILLQEEVKVLNTYTSEEYLIYKTKKDKRFNLYFFDKKKKLVKIINSSKYKEKIVFSFLNINKTITINHKNIKLTIDLKRLK